jgi:hypothetical protein
LNDFALVAEKVKVTVPLPSPLGFCVVTPTGVAATTKLEGFTTELPVSVLPESPLHEKNKKADKKTLNISLDILELVNCFFIFRSIGNKNKLRTKIDSEFI